MLNIHLTLLQTWVHVENWQTSVSPPLLLSLWWTWVFLCGERCGLIIAPFLPSCCCFIAFFWLPGFNKPLYQLVTTQTPLVITAALFNFLTGYLFEGEGSRGENRKHQLVASVSTVFFISRNTTTCLMPFNINTGFIYTPLQLLVILWRRAAA